MELSLPDKVIILSKIREKKKRFVKAHICYVPLSFMFMFFHDYLFTFQSSLSLMMSVRGMSVRDSTSYTRNLLGRTLSTSSRSCFQWAVFWTSPWPPFQTLPESLLPLTPFVLPLCDVTVSCDCHIHHSCSHLLLVNCASARSLGSFVSAWNLRSRRILALFFSETLRVFECVFVDHRRVSHKQSPNLSRRPLC